MTVINRETPVNIGWGVASYNENRGYFIRETRSTRSAARQRARELNRRVGRQMYRTVRLSATHP